jgi:hypothetical protein
VPWSVRWRRSLQVQTWRRGKGLPCRHGRDVSCCVKGVPVRGGRILRPRGITFRQRSCGKGN